MKSAAGRQTANWRDPQIAHLEQADFAARAQGEISGGGAGVQPTNWYDPQIAHLEQAWQCAEGERPRGCRVKSAAGRQRCSQPTGTTRRLPTLSKRGRVLRLNRRKGAG